MRILRPFIIAAALASPITAAAETAPSPDDALRDGLQRFFEQLRPAWDRALDFLEEYEGIDDPRHYTLPEVLPNGDIIIRRRPDAPPFKQSPNEASPEDPATIDL